MVRDESDRYGISMSLGKYVFILIFGTAAILLLTVYSILENQRLRKELEGVKKAEEYSAAQFETTNEAVQMSQNLIQAELKSIYLILAQQSSNMRTIMNVGITNSHWSKHAGRVFQHDCPECLVIYKQIQDQREKLSKEVGYERANFPLSERLQAPKTGLDKEGVKDNADKQGRGN